MGFLGKFFEVFGFSSKQVENDPETIELFKNFLHSKDLFNKYRENFNELRPPDYLERVFFKICKPEDFVAAAFTWICTPQGSDFWSSIDTEWLKHYDTHIKLKEFYENS